MAKKTGYDLSRNWFDFCFDNPEKIKPNHTALYFFAIEHCNRLGWKNKFGFPSQMAMEAIGVKNWRTYNKTLTDLVEFGFIAMVEKSKNQYSSNIISLKSAYVKNTKALDKALQKHSTKHSTKQGQSTVSINKQVTSNKETNKQPQNEFLQEREILNNVYDLFDFKIISNLTINQKNDWLDVINKLNRLDNYTYTEIEDTIIWGRNDDFWRSNFHSILGLRKKKKETGLSKFFQINKKMNYERNNGTKHADKQAEDMRKILEDIANDPDLL